jgi:hypothetical protein
MYPSSNDTFPEWALRLLIVLSLFNLKAVTAGSWKGPQQTNDAPFLDDALQPGPTAAPMGDLELFKRQNAPGSSVCGYISGDLC